MQRTRQLRRLVGRMERWNIRTIMGQILSAEENNVPLAANQENDSN